MGQRVEKILEMALSLQDDSSAESDWDSSTTSDDSIEEQNDSFDEISSDEDLYCDVSANVSLQADTSSPTNNQSAASDWEPVSKTSTQFSCSVPLNPVLSDVVAGQDPIDFFNLLITDDIMDLMVIETNKYAKRLKGEEGRHRSRIAKWAKTDRNELRIFFAIIISMGLVNVPKIQLYWSKNNLYNNAFISNLMPRDRFLILLRCWHFAKNLKNTNNKLSKLRPLITSLLKNFQKCITPGENVVIHESMVPGQDRLSIKKFYKTKLRNYRVKLYKVCTVNGYTYNFKVYIGKGDPNPGENHSVCIVKNLMDGLTGCGRTVFTDDFFTSIKAAEYLLSNNTHLCGKLRPNRRNLPHRITSEKIITGEIIGEMKNNIKVIKWMDKRPMLMLTTKEKHDLSLIFTKHRSSSTTKPECVVDYNNAKKEVECSYQMASNYYALSKGLKWYRKVVLELIFGSSMINAWLLYNSKHQGNMSILTFKELVAKSLTIGTGDIDQGMSLTVRTLKRIHTLQTDPDKTKRKRCSGCYKTLRKHMVSQVAVGKTKKVRTYCEDCEGRPPLCLSCFNNSHEKLRIELIK